MLNKNAPQYLGCISLFDPTFGLHFILVVPVCLKSLEDLFTLCFEEEPGTGGQSPVDDYTCGAEA